SGVSQTIWYAKSIAARAAGTNTVTVTFSGSMPYVDLRAAEYSGVDPVNPIDVTASAAGSSSAARSRAVTTTFANELLFGAGMTFGGFSAATGGATTRIITTPDLDIVQDQVVSAVGTYSATASLYGNAAWVMQMIALRAAGAATTTTSTSTTQPPTTTSTSTSTTSTTRPPTTTTTTSTTTTVPRTTTTPVTTTTTTTTPPAFVQVVAATPQTNQTSVPVTFAGAQTAGNVNLVAIGWNSSSGSVSSVVDSAGNVYQPAAPVQFGSG